jgi:hypothetical protein
VADNGDIVKAETGTTLPMQGIRRWPFIAELLICFGPCTAMAFFGLTALGPSLSHLVFKALGIIHPADDISWWHTVLPILLSLGALGGLFALMEVARALMAGRSSLSYPSKVIAPLALTGIAAIAALGVELIPPAPAHPVTVLCVYLPLLALPHVIFKTRRLLFPAIEP